MGDSFTIQISKNLVNQLADNGEKFKKTKKTKSRIPQQPQSKLQEKKISETSETHKETAAKGWPIQPPFIRPVTPSPQPEIAELEAIRSVLQESETVVEKLKKQEENMVQEVTQRAKDLRDKEFKLPYQKPMPCLAEKDACVACYKEHLTDPLKCAQTVKNLADCSRRVRQEVSSADK